MATQITGALYVFFVITMIAILIVILIIQRKLYSIVKKLQERYPKKYNEMLVEPWFKKSQSNLGIWARTRWLGWKLVFNWDWFPEEIKQDSKWLRVISIAGFVWFLLIIVVIFIIIF